MGVRIFVLLTLSLGCTCLDQGDIADLLTYMHNHHEQLSTIVHQYINPKYLPFHQFLSSFDDPDTCARCHHEGAKFIMERSMDGLGKVCKMAPQKDCKLVKLCEFKVKKPEVTMGMMIEHVRPFSLTMAYCLGKGVCHKPNKTTVAEVEMGEQPHEVLLNHFDQIDWHGVIDGAKELPETQEDEEDSDGDAATCEMPHRVCPKCMKRSMKRVMRHAVRKVKGMCMHSQCPKMQRMCRFAREHRAVAFGMLLAKVEPWKFAFGHCSGQRGDAFWGFVKKVKQQLQEFITVIV